MTTPATDNPGDESPAATRLPDILRAGLEPLPIGILMAGEDGAIVFVNRALERMVEYTSAELIGQPVEVLVPEGTRSVHVPLRQQYASQPQPQPHKTGAGRRELFARRKNGSEIPVEIELTPLQFSDRRLVLAAITDLSQQLHHEAALARMFGDRIAFEQLVAELTAQFVNLRADDVDRAIDDAFARLAEALRLDRCALIQLDEQTGIASHTHEWQRPGAPGPPQRIPAQEQFPWHLSRIRAGDIVSFATVDDVPDAVDRDSLRQLGIRASVTIPVVVNGRVRSVAAFATMQAPRTWPPEITTTLCVFAHALANVVTRKHSDESLRRVITEHADARERLREENAYLQQELNTLVGVPSIVGSSPGFRRMLEQVQHAAASADPVLLIGEPGTGKSLLAHRIHELGPRREHALVRVHCAALAVASVDAELYGRDDGSGMLAQRRRPGLLELANGSSVFFDDVVDLPLDAQASLARVLQHGEIQPVGTERRVKATFRVIAATTRDPKEAVDHGTLRHDLYERLSVQPIHMLPLRERIEDIPLLVWRFVNEFSARYGKTIDTIDQQSMRALQAYRWPENARELRNLVERSVIMAGGRHLAIRVPG